MGADFKVQFISVVATCTWHEKIGISTRGLTQHLASDESLPDGF